MSVLAEAPAGAQAPPAPPGERHGKCRVIMCINDDIYFIKMLKAQSSNHLWELRKRTGERAGAKYRAGRLDGDLACTCPDHSASGVACKHLRSLVAQRLVARPRAKKGGA